jgi:uncharacterized membrane protein
VDDIIAQIQAAFMAFLVFFVIVFVISIVVGWKLFEKAGRPGWEVLIPIYGSYVFIVHVLKLSAAWFWLQLIPIVNIFVALILMFLSPFKCAENFGKSAGFGLLLLPIVFYPILAFGSARHVNSRPTKRQEEETW